MSNQIIIFKLFTNIVFGKYISSRFQRETWLQMNGYQIHYLTGNVWPKGLAARNVDSFSRSVLLECQYVCCNLKRHFNCCSSGTYTTGHSNDVMEMQIFLSFFLQDYVSIKTDPGTVVHVLVILFFSDNKFCETYEIWSTSTCILMKLMVILVL